MSDDQYALVQPLQTGFGEIVPAGFCTDGASIPRFLWSIIGHPFSGTVLRGAIIHDWMYRYGAWPRQEADAQLAKHMLGNGTHPARAWIIWAAVRLFGWLYWRKVRFGRGISA